MNKRQRKKKSKQIIEKIFGPAKVVKVTIDVFQSQLPEKIHFRFITEEKNMIANWKDPEKTKPPKGVPLIVTIKRNWQHWTETLGPVYYMQSPWNGDVQFRTHGDWDGVIGPNDIKVIAWDFWPDAYQEGDAYA